MSAYPIGFDKTVEHVTRMVPEFSGGIDEKLIFFINACELVAEITPTANKDIILRTILTRIRGQAYEVIRYEEITSWEMLKTLLKNTYDKPINAAYLQIELFSTKQRYKESLIEYATRIRNLVQAVSEVMVKSKNPSTLEQAIQIAIIEDKNIIPSEVRANNHNYKNSNYKAKGEAQKYNKGNCHVCGKYGHYARDCRFKNGSPKNKGGKPKERKSIEQVCIDFMDLFHLEGDRLTHTTSIEHEIRTPEREPPIYQRQYRLPQSQRNEITKQIIQMESGGILEPSSSHWNSPILLVPKKIDVSGKPKFRLVVDFRKLNNITVGDKMPLPQIQDVLDRLGRNFVPDYGKIAKPTTNLLKKGIEFIWTSECQEAFEKLKNILCNEPLLQYPDFEKPFIITCDASNYAVGCVLSEGVIPADLPIAYASRTLNKAEINYSTTEKELVAIMLGVKQF
ncbi:hypothetical protein QTP88_007074 [Uroleucon formosanum]